MYSANKHPDGVVARIDRDLENLKNGLSLLGVKPCCCCGTFFRSSERNRLFDCGDLVCLDCIYEWWTSRVPELPLKQRELVERKLVNWLVNHHRAQVIRKADDLLNPTPRKFQLVVSCAHCDGRGVCRRTPCRACDGRGTVWLAICE
jgi:hypothetical protein